MKGRQRLKHLGSNGDRCACYLVAHLGRGSEVLKKENRRWHVRIHCSSPDEHSQEPEGEFLGFAHLLEDPRLLARFFVYGGVDLWCRYR